MYRKTKFLIFLIIIISSILFCFFVKNYVIANSKNTYEILVDVEASKLYLFKNGNLEEEFKCAGGKPSTPSPIGTWTINSKGKWGEGFGGSWMRI